MRTAVGYLDGQTPVSQIFREGRAEPASRAFSVQLMDRRLLTVSAAISIGPLAKPRSSDLLLQESDQCLPPHAGCRDVIYLI